MTHVELSLIGILIGVLGVGGGKVWGTRQIGALRKEVEKRCKVCLEERKEKEAALDKEIRDQIKPRLIFGNLLMMKLCEKSGISKDEVEQIRSAVTSDMTPEKV